MGRLLRLLFVLSLLLMIGGITWYFFFPQDVDFLFVNAKIHTLDEDNETAEAMAVSGDRIVGVGSRSSAERRFKAKRVVDLHGRTVLPGFIDAHAHLLSLGISKITVDLTGASTEQEAAARVRTRAAKGQPGQWIRGRGWDQNLWQSKRFPVHETLDRVAPATPVVLTRVDGHACWVNKEVLKIAGINTRTKDPEGGRIIRDARGEPTGVFIDAAMDLVMKHLPPLSRIEAVDALARAVEECLKYGVTTVHDMGADSQDIDLYMDVIGMLQFPIRVYAAISVPGDAWDSFLEQGPLIGFGENRLTVRAIKLYVDGALGSRGAALIEAYSDDLGNRGLTVSSEHDLRSTVREALTHGFQPCTHAIGDRGNNIVLNVYEEVLKEIPVPDHRLRIEHAQVLDSDDIPRFKTLGVIPSMQPTHCTSDMYWAEARLGPKRVRGSYAWRSILNTGVIIAGGSDFPVESPNPLYGIYAAVTRQDQHGRPSSAEDIEKYFQISHQGSMEAHAFKDGWYGNERMTRDEAVRSFTSWAAFAGFEEKLKGSIEEGKLADFIVLSKDIMVIPPQELLSTMVEMTVVGGKAVYKSSPSITWIQ